MIPARVQQLLSSHTLSDAVFMLHGSFGHLLAKVLGLDCHCIPLYSALSSHMYLEMIYHLSATHRQLLFEKFSEDFEECCTLVKRDSKEMESLQQQYDIAKVIAALHAPVYSLPTELLGEIFRISVEQFDVTPSTLQRVCQTWRALVARLWGTLQVETWTDATKISAVLDKNPLSLDVVIDTTKDENVSTIAEKPYRAFALAWTSVSKWNSLTIHSFPSSASKHARNVVFDPCAPLNHLESLSVGPGCESSDHINEVMSTIASTANPKLTSLTLAATAVFRQLNHSDWIPIYSQLTVLDLDVGRVGEPVDLLSPCKRLEILKLSGVVLHNLPPGEELPLRQTLRELWLKQASIQWMDGRVFERLGSCTLLRPVDPQSINQTNTISLPVCTSITLHSRMVSLLAAFDARVANKIEIECNESIKARASRALRRVWTQKSNCGVLRPKVLSLSILCDDQALLGALQQMSSLEELVLKLPRPSALGASFFEALCAVPVKPFTGTTKEQWSRWANDEAEWRPGSCPSLAKLHLQYNRWLRGGEMDSVSPRFIAVAWSRGKLRSPPLQKFEIKLGDANPLQLMGMTYQDPSFMHLWQNTQVIPQSDAQKDMLYTSSLTTVITRSLGFDNANSALPFGWLGNQYYDSFFRHLRVFHHHPPELPPHPYDILPSFKHLEELRVSNFHFTPCPPAAELPLCQTLRILHIRDTPLDWMNERIFDRVIDCRIEVCKSEHTGELSRVVMPACTRMEFVGHKHPDVLEFFYPPNHDERFERSRNERPHNNPRPVQATVLTIPQIPRIPVKAKDKNVKVVSRDGTDKAPEGKTDKKAKGRFFWLRKLLGSSST